jgi:hypothetical protein
MTTIAVVSEVMKMAMIMLMAMAMPIAIAIWSYNQKIQQ